LLDRVAEGWARVWCQRSGMGSGFVFARRSNRCVRGLPRGSLWTEVFRLSIENRAEAEAEVCRGVLYLSCAIAP
jgi:hypothetical protein